MLALPLAPPVAAKLLLVLHTRALARAAGGADTRALIGTATSGHHGHAGRKGKVGGSLPALSGLAVAPAEASPEGGFLISTRLPTSKRIYEPATDLLVTNLDLVLQDPEALAKAAEIFGASDLLTEAEAKLPPKERVLAAVASMKENLRLLYNDYEPALAERAASWYFGAHRIAGELAAQHEMEPAQVAAVIASLSPQMDWFQNLSLAERVITTTKQFDHENPVFSRDLYDQFAAKWEPATAQKFARAQPASFHGSDAEWATHQTQLAAGRNAEAQAILSEVGTPWKSLTPSTQAFMLRAHDEVKNPRSYAVTTPEGDRLGPKLTNEGKAQDIGWGTSVFIENAISLTRNGSIENISDRLGGAPKVRSFYNNIADPWDGRSVTIDTHATAAAFLKPLSGASREATMAMGGGSGNLPANNTTGLKGTNAIVAQAYFDLAQELGILPDRLQSVVWEAGRGLFRPEQKRSVEGRALALKTEQLWAQYRQGALSRKGLYESLKDTAGGIAPPAWSGSPISEQGRVVTQSVLSGRRAVPGGRRGLGEHAGGLAGVDAGADSGRIFRGVGGSLAALRRGNFGHAGRPGEVGGSAARGFVPATAAQRAALVLPPAWTEVRVNPDPDGALQAVGIDAAGRTQYRYSATHSAAAAAEKFARLKAFHEALPALRAQVQRDLQSADPATREHALLVDLIDKTGFRVGSEKDTRAAKQAFGATTLRASHVDIDGDAVRFRFTGKKGQTINKTVHDQALADALAPRVAAGGRTPLFPLTSDHDLRAYVERHAPGFTPKDFRTYHGTMIALREIAKMAVPKTATAKKKAMGVVADRVARFLGNTRTVAMKSYIDPAAFAAWDAR